MKHPFTPEKSTSPSHKPCYEGRFSVLAEFPKLPTGNQPAPLKELTTGKTHALPFKASPSERQTRDNYEMKSLESYSGAVKPVTPVKQETPSASSNTHPPKWEFIVSQALPIMALDKHKTIKIIKIKGWSPKVKEDVKKKSPVSSGETSVSKAEVKRRLLEALSKLENNEDPSQIMELIDTASSSTGEPDNGDMLAPRGIAQSYFLT
ncbi:hypothetical protein K7X08_015011 [Anisodus acutangulus]|uniref:Uncharacterized protein n=1 Tax=Anisodus acutangulus TaxID=402998 RepID=A0A9Q1L514_9SOLA|nr:hypothetical protein K7X08_015011 [Anisodus acutangulus]